MARTNASLGFLCRSCRKALETASPSLPRQLQLRSFSNTTTRLKHLATFTETSSPELNSVLSRYRQEVFLPSILPPHHQALIYKTARHDMLTAPPGVTVTVQTALPPSTFKASEAGEEDIKLKSLNKFDRPNRTRSLATIQKELSKITDATAWDNLIPFLEGMRFAREPLPADFLQGLAMRANAQGEGRWNTLLTAATMVSRTGVRLSQQNFTRELVLGAHFRGAESSFKRSEPSRTFDQIAVLLETDGHCGAMRKDATDVDKSGAIHSDMRSDPLVLAANLSFTAAKVLRNTGLKAKDDGTVASALSKLLAIHSQLESSGGLLGHANQQYESKAPVYQQNLALEDLSVYTCALGLADKVDMSNSLGREQNIKASVIVSKLLKQMQESIVRKRADVQAHFEPRGKIPRAFKMLDATEQSRKELIR